MNARSMWISGQVNVAQGHSSRKLHRLATTQRAECKEVLPRNHGKTKRTLELNAQEFEINESNGNMQYHYTQRKEGWRHQHTCLQRQKDNILQSDRQISQTITKGVQIHHGDGRNRQQCNSS